MSTSMAVLVCNDLLSVPVVQMAGLRNFMNRFKSWFAFGSVSSLKLVDEKFLTCRSKTFAYYNIAEARKI